jgi:Tfp pilus assembly protein PilO
MANETRKIDLLKIIRETSEKKISYIFAGVTIFVSILLIIGAIKPTITTMTRIRAEISKKEDTEAALAEKISALSELDSQYIGLKNDFNNISLVFPTDGDFSLFMANIDAVSSRNSYILESLSFSEYKEENPLNTIVIEPWSVKLTVAGNRANLINFLKDLESLPMYPVIESITFTEDSDTEEASRFTVNLRIYQIPVNNFYD